MSKECLSPACKWRPPGTCVYYSGDHIPAFEISNGDNLNVLVSKITSHIEAGGAVEESPNVGVNTNSVTLTLSGINNRTIQADVKRSTQADNKLSIGVAGLYVPPASFTTNYNSGTGVFSLTIDGETQDITLSGGVTSIFGRTGDVVALPNDYNWPDIGNTPTTLAGYAITDPIVLETSSYADPVWITSLAKSKVGLGSVPNIDTTNATNITSGTLGEARIDAAIARLASPALTGTPTAPTAAAITNTTQLATCEFVHDVVASVSSGVTTFNGRSGAVVPVSGDYTWNQINKATSSLADITTRSAADLSSGTLNDLRLSSNVPLLNISNTFTGVMTLSNLAGSGTRIVKASSTGVLSASAITSTDVGLGSVPNVDATNASNISSGTLDEARLSANIPRLDSFNVFTTGNQFSTLGIGVSPAAGLHIVRTTEQIRSGYDSGNYLSVTTSSNANTTLELIATSGSPVFNVKNSIVLEGNFQTSNISTNANLTVFSTTAVSTSNTALQINSSPSIAVRILERGGSSPTIGSGDAYCSHVIGTQTVLENGTGAHPFMGQLAIKSLSVINNIGSSTTHGATLYVEGALTGITPTVGNYAVWVDSGNVRLDSLAGSGTRMVVSDDNGVLSTQALPAGGGDVVGPVSATDNAVARFDATTGKLIQNSAVTISDAGAVVGVSTLNGVYPEQQVILGSDVVISSAATWSSITGLSFSAVAGQTYHFKAFIIFDADSTGTGSKWALTGTASPTILSYYSHHSATVTTFFANEALDTYDAGSASPGAASTAGNSARVEGIIKPSSTGNVTFRGWSETASGITAKTGSIVFYRRIA